MIEVDTPAVVVDVDRLEHNLARWQAHCDAVGLANRPHVKTHKSVEIARRQVALGARGITCQKLGEAEVMADAGIDDILIPYNLIGASKLERLAALARRVEVAVSVDDERLSRGSRAQERRRVRSACSSSATRASVASAWRAPRRRQHWPGRSSAGTGSASAASSRIPPRPGAVAFLAEAERRARAAGLDVETVSAGGTPTMWASGELRPTVTEYRVGTYAFHDRATVAAGAATADEVALTVRATVVSRPSAERAVLDAGSKVLTHDPCSEPGYGTILEAPGPRRVAERGARRRRRRTGRLARARTAGPDRAEPRLRGRQPGRRARRPR